MPEPEVRLVDESGDTRLAGSLLAPENTPSGRFLKTGANGATSWGTGGGGGGGVQVVTVPISSAQILDLANTPVTLVAGVAGNVTNVLGICIAYIAGATPYTVTDGALGIYLGPVMAGAGISSVAQSGFIDQAVDEQWLQGFGLSGVSPLPQAAADVILTNAATDATLGNGTLLVTVSYFLAPTT